MKPLRTTLLFLTLAGALGAPALADDVRPPFYRGLELSVRAEWQNVTSIPAGQPTPPTVFEAFTTPQYPLFQGIETQLVCLPELDGFLYRVEMQNIEDDLPLKFLRLQVTTISPIPPVEPLVNIIGFDNALAPPDSVLVNGGLVEVVSVAAGAPFRDVFVYDFVLEPNPDFEIIEIFVPFEMEVDQIVVDSISTVPEPAYAGFLAGACMLTLVLSRRYSRRPRG
ncbi:MAG: hypothetical protein ACFB20_11230 [Opitutales bacterium]